MLPAALEQCTALLARVAPTLLPTDALYTNGLSWGEAVLPESEQGGWSDRNHHHDSA